MRILVIGGTNFSGPHMVSGLVAMGHDLILFHRNAVGENFQNRLGPLSDKVRHILGDRKNLKDYADDFTRFAPEIIVDMVATTEQHALDVMGLFAGIAHRVIAISSVDVYRAFGKLNNFESGELEAMPLSEEAPLRGKYYPYREQVDPGHRLYHYDKRLVERVYMGNPDLPGTILRYPMVYGPGDRQHRLFQYLKRMDDGRPAILLAQGMVDWVWTKGYSENIAEGVVLAAMERCATGKIYNVGEEQPLSEADWVRAIGVAAGWRGKVVVVPTESSAGHLEPDFNTAQHLVIDTSRIRAELGYREQVTREEALRRTVAWERAHPPEKIDEQVFNYAHEDAILRELE
ncbi:NAD-dependent epimerase/dehydratase family protein [Chloroflexota bacterium]